MQGPESILFQKAYAEWRNGIRHISISSSDIVLFNYRQYIREELKKRPERFWVSPDIAVIEDITLEPNSVTFVPVHIPFPMSPFTDFHPYAFSCTYATTRSRFAQLGVDVNANTGVSIAQTAASLVDENDQYKGLLASIAVINQAKRAIRLPEDAKFFYLYYWNGSTIRGKDLQDLIGSKIRVKGEEHKDFRFWYGQIPTGREEDIKGIEFFIDPKSRSWIPPHSEPTTIDDDLTGNHNRSAVDRFLVKPVPKSQEAMLWIAETLAELELDSSVHGLLDMVVSDDDSLDFQTNSVLFRGGNTYGRMRTEIRSRTEEHLMPQTVLMRFAWA